MPNLFSAAPVVIFECPPAATSGLTRKPTGAVRPIAAATDDLEAALDARLAPTVLVANEVGFGIVPDNALARRFRDEAGRLHQRLAADADRVVLTVAGLPLTVKGPPA